MSNFRDQIIKLAFDNPGEVRNALLLSLAKTSVRAKMSPEEKAHRKKQKLAHAALNAIMALNSHAIGMERKGVYGDFGKAVKEYLKVAPEADSALWKDVNKGFHAFRSAVSALSSDHLGGGKNRLIPKDTFKDYPSPD